MTPGQRCRRGVAGKLGDVVTPSLSHRAAPSPGIQELGLAGLGHVAAGLGAVKGVSRLRQKAFFHGN